MNPFENTACNQCEAEQKPLTHRIASHIEHLQELIGKKTDEINSLKKGIEDLNAVKNAIDSGILPEAVISTLDKAIV